MGRDTLVETGLPATPSETAIINTIGFPDIVPLSNSDIIRNGNGLDMVGKIRNSLSDASVKYEKKCFSQIISKTGETQILGPSIMDHLLDNNFTHRLCRPDAMEFSTNDDVWKLEELYEFKSGKRNHNVLKKLDGFKELLDYFRSDPSYLPDILKRGLSEVVKTPKIVEIPADKDITVTFIYPNKASSFSSYGIPFNLRYKQIKA